MTKEYKVGDTVYAKCKILQVDEDDDKYPYGVVFSNHDYTDAWISDQAIVEPPAKPTLPKGVADEIEDYKLKGFDLIDYFTSFNECADDVKNSSKYMCDNTDEVNNQRVANLANAWNNGYTVEKPKLYNLIFDNNYNGKIICLFKLTLVDELWAAYNIGDTSLKHNEEYQFTQEEIDECNKSFWIKNVDLNDYKVEVQTDEE